MPLPHAVARLNRRYTNRFLEPIAARSPRFARVHHVGRHSGQTYTTPLWAFASDKGPVVVLTYGPDVDWLRNIQAGPAHIEGWVSGDITGVGVARRDSFVSVLPWYARWFTALARINQVAVLMI